MVTAVHQEQNLGSLLREFISPGKPRLVGLSFLVLVAAQSLGLLALGTGRWGCSLSESLIVLGNLVALACAWIAFQRARGISSIFWFLFAGILLVWLVPNSLHAYGRLIGQSILSDSTWRLLYCLYGAPILMILFLPDTYEHARAKSEVYLDLFQIGIVVALVYSSFFFIPASHLQPEDAFLRNLSVSDAQSIVLMVAVLLRLQLARTAAARDLFRRFAIFLFVCAVMTLAGDWIDRHQFVSLSVWYNLVWALNQAAPALIAISWMPEPETTTRPEPARFINLLTVNLALVAMLVTINLLMDHWKQDHGELLTDIAITASLVAFTLRLALTQHRQQLEIFHRKEAQEQLAASNRKVVRLLDDSRRQTSEITQISELGSLLQACAKREEVFRLIPERMRRLFPMSRARFFFSLPPRTASRRPHPGASVPSARSSHQPNAGLCAGDRLTCIRGGAPARNALTSRGRALLSAFRSSPWERRLECSPSRTTISRAPVPSRSRAPIMPPVSSISLPP